MKRLRLNILSLILFTCLATGLVKASVNTDRVERWGIFELSLSGPVDGNPFVDVQLAEQKKLSQSFPRQHTANWPAGSLRIGDSQAVWLKFTGRWQGWIYKAKDISADKETSREDRLTIKRPGKHKLNI